MCALWRRFLMLLFFSSPLLLFFPFLSVLVAAFFMSTKSKKRKLDKIQVYQDHSGSLDDSDVPSRPEKQPRLSVRNTNLEPPNSYPNKRQKTTQSDVPPFTDPVKQATDSSLGHITLPTALLPIDKENKQV
jgi:hypothetical protein